MSTAVHSQPPPICRVRRVLRGDLLDFTADPGFHAPDQSPGVRHRPDHLVLVLIDQVNEALQYLQGNTSGEAEATRAAV